MKKQKLSVAIALGSIILIQGCTPGSEINSQTTVTKIATPVKALELENEPSQKITEAADKIYSPSVRQNHPKDVYWGDTHLHTSYSMDAAAGGDRLGPDMAYRFARGEEVVSSGGRRVKLSRPLDFMVVADHSDNWGMITDLLDGNKKLLAHPQGKIWYDQMMSGDSAGAVTDLIIKFTTNTFPKELIYQPDTAAFRGVWDRIVAAAEKHNDPGKFTALIGYEWTSLVNGGDNLHRVVIYKDNADKALQVIPYTTFPPLGSPNPMDLWKWMDNYEAKTGGSILAIAHNGNLSNGIMFPVDAQYDGRVLDKLYIEQRASKEPLYEITQMKGDGEAHPFLSPDDEFADYENWDVGNLNVTTLKKDDMLAKEYAREALKNGLLLEQRFGTNPYKVGLIGSTDSHTSLASSEENNFYGKTSAVEPSSHRLDKVMIGSDVGQVYYRQTIASGLAAVWAKENTRAAIYDALQRKETYGTTGTRMRVRFFAGWEFNEQDIFSPHMETIAYAKGVPMGGDLSSAPKGEAPKFMLQSLKDPDGANLDRVQIIKGWLDAEGKTHERIYDVACADNRDIKARRCEGSVGSTVDIKTATYKNTIGDAQLLAYWEDPDFDPAQKAFYYVRVLEIPTPRWSTYDALFFGVELPKDVPSVQQERAYTSPIWYTP